MFAGLLTNVSVSVLGAVLTVAGCVGWFREVFPRQHEVELRVVPEEFAATHRAGASLNGCRSRPIRSAPGFLSTHTRSRQA